MKMNSLMMGLALALAGAFLMGCAQTDLSQPVVKVDIDRSSVNGLPRMTATQSVQAEAKVEAIDYDNHSIALLSADGKTEIFQVSRFVRNFPQIKKGDLVKVDYDTRLAAAVYKVTDTPPSTEISTLVVPAPLGDKPGVLCVRQARIEATVVAINYETRAVKLQTVSGNIVSFTADKKLVDFDKVHAGDQVIFDYNETITITVVAPASK